MSLEDDGVLIGLAVRQVSFMQVARLPQRAPGVFEMAKQRVRALWCIYITFLYVVCGDQVYFGVSNMGGSSGGMNEICLVRDLIVRCQSTVGRNWRCRHIPPYTPYQISEHLNDGTRTGNGRSRCHDKPGGALCELVRATV